MSAVSYPSRISRKLLSLLSQSSIADIKLSKYNLPLPFKLHSNTINIRHPFPRSWLLTCASLRRLLLIFSFQYCSFDIRILMQLLSPQPSDWRHDLLFHQTTADALISSLYLMLYTPIDVSVMQVTVHSSLCISDDYLYY